jgi:chromosome partitioning protein
LLVGLPQELLYLTNPNIILRDFLYSVRDEYDYIILDCPPTLNLLTINALCAAQEIIIPLQAEFFAMEGLQSLFEAIELVQKTMNPQLKIGGILFNMLNSSTLCQEICAEVQQHFSELLFSTRIPRTIKISEAQSHELTIQLYAPHIQASKAYNQLAREIINRHSRQNQKDQPWVDRSLGEG